MRLHPFQDPNLPVEVRITNILNPSGTTSRRT